VANRYEPGIRTCEVVQRSQKSQNHNVGGIYRGGSTISKLVPPVKRYTRHRHRKKNNPSGVSRIRILEPRPNLRGSSMLMKHLGNVPNGFWGGFETPNIPNKWRCTSSPVTACRLHPVSCSVLVLYRRTNYLSRFAKQCCRRIFSLKVSWWRYLAQSHVSYPYTSAYIFRRRDYHMRSLRIQLNCWM
jgi:hypothetical protein